MQHYRIHQKRSFGDLTVLLTEYFVGGPTDIHAHKNARLVLVLQGKFQEDFGPSSRICSASTLIYRPAEETHREKFLSKQNLCLSVDIGPVWMRRLGQDLDIRDSLCFLSPQLIPICTRLTRELQNRDSFCEPAIETLLLDILSLPTRKFSPPRPVWLKRVVDMLMSTSQQLRVRQLAREAGVHPVYLARAFRRYHGCTVFEYVRALRIQKSRCDLLASKDSITEIAWKNGFSDQSHFTRVFKSATGVTPARYRSDSL